MMSTSGFVVRGASGSMPYSEESHCSLICKVDIWPHNIHTVELSNDCWVTTLITARH